MNLTQRSRPSTNKNKTDKTKKLLPVIRWPLILSFSYYKKLFKYATVKEKESAYFSWSVELETHVFHVYIRSQRAKLLGIKSAAGTVSAGPAVCSFCLLNSHVRVRHRKPCTETGVGMESPIQFLLTVAFGRSQHRSPASLVRRLKHPLLSMCLWEELKQIF